MDGSLEMKTIDASDGSKPTFFRKKWEKRYCVLTTQTLDGEQAFILLCYRAQELRGWEEPEQCVQLAAGFVALDVANSSAGSIVFSVQSVSCCVYLRTTVSFVAHGWVTGIRALQFAELVGWSEQQLCCWLRAGGVAEETLSLLEQCNLDGMYFAAIGCTRDKKTEIATHLQRNLGIGPDESSQMIEMLSSIQTPDILAWLEDKDRELEHRYPQLSDAVKLFAIKVQNDTKRKVETTQQVTRHEQELTIKREKQQAARHEVERVERVALDSARVAEKEKRKEAAVHIQRVWRGGKDRHYVDTVLQQLDYRGNGSIQPKKFYDAWKVEVEKNSARCNDMEAGAATKIATEFRRYTRQKAFCMARMEKHLAAADIQKAWRRKTSGADGELHPTSSQQQFLDIERLSCVLVAWADSTKEHRRCRYLLDRAGIRRRLRFMWEAFFAWEEWNDRMQKVERLQLKAHHRMKMRLAISVFDGWAIITLRKLRARAMVQQAVNRMRDLHVTIAFHTWQQLANDAAQIRLAELNFVRNRLARVLVLWSRWSVAEKAHRLKAERLRRKEEAKQHRIANDRRALREAAERRKRQAEERRVRLDAQRKARVMDERNRRLGHAHTLSDNQRRKKEQLAVALLTRARDAQDLTLLEEALASAAAFPALQTRCDECRNLHRKVAGDYIEKAHQSGDVVVVTKAISLAQRHGLSTEAEELEKWKRRVRHVKSLISTADKSGDDKKIEEAVLAAQGFSCFDKQIRALQQMKALLADVQLLLNQALERKDPDDVQMAIKVASRFESIRQSLKYKRLLDLQNLMTGARGTTGARTIPGGRGRGSKRVSPRASATRNRRPLDDDRPGADDEDSHSETSSGSADSTTRRGGRRKTTPEKSGNLSTGSSPASSPDSMLTGSDVPVAPAEFRPEVAEMILHCAQWVAQHGPAFEKTLKEKNAANPAFKFLHSPESDEGQYYQSCLAHERGLALVKISKQSAAKVNQLIALLIESPLIGVRALLHDYRTVDPLA
jgi:hypothetical protein